MWGQILSRLPDLVEQLPKTCSFFSRLNVSVSSPLQMMTGLKKPFRLFFSHVFSWAYLCLCGGPENDFQELVLSISWVLGSNSGCQTWWQVPLPVEGDKNLDISAAAGARTRDTAP